MPEIPERQTSQEVPDEQPALQSQDSPIVNSASDGGTGSQFETAAQQPGPNVIFEFVDFLRHNKRWWLTPIILVLLVFSVFIALTSSAIAPFIYVLF